MVSITQGYRAILRQELKARMRVNKRYSLRAFARHLGVSPHHLSAVLNRKFGLSGESAIDIAERLKFSVQQTEYFHDLVESEHARSPKAREAAKERLEKLRGVDLWPRTVPALQIKSHVYPKKEIRSAERHFPSHLGEQASEFSEESRFPARVVEILSIRV